MPIFTSRTHRRLIWALAVVLVAGIVSTAALTQGTDSAQPAAQPRASVPALANPAGQGSGQTPVAKLALARTHTPDRRHTSRQAGAESVHPGRRSHARSSGQAVPANATAQLATATRAVPAVPQGGRTIKTFAGSGNGRIGSVSERTTTVLEWRAPGHGIQIFTSRGALLVDSTTGIGSVRLPRGEYADLRVASRGSWVIRLRAQLS